MREPGDAPPPRPPTRRGSAPPLAWDLLAAGVAVLLGALLHLWGASLDPTARDQVHDLSLALRIRDGTALSDGNRHPLFPALLAPLAGRDAAFQTRALLVSVVVTALAAFAAYRAAAAVFGRPLGVLALLVGIVEWKLQGRRICPEPLLAGLLAVSVALLAQASAGDRPLRRTGASGAILGLAWLTKGSALLSLAAALASVGLRRRPTADRPAASRAASALVLVAGFLATASPLVVANVRAGRGPLENASASHVVWEERWDGDLDDRSTATAATWWAAHGAADAVRRLTDGFVRQKGVEFVYVAFGVLGLDALRRRRRRRDGASSDATRSGEARTEPERAWVSLAAWNGALWLLAFAWYAPIVSSRRLLFPIFPILIPPTLAAIGRLGGAASMRRAADAVAARARTALLLGVALLMLLGAGASLLAAGPPSARRPIAPVWLAAADAIRARCPSGARILVRPSRDHPPDWLVDDRVAFLELPRGVADDDAGAWIRAHADFVLENDGLVRSRPVVRALVEPLPTVWESPPGDRASRLRRVDAPSRSR